MIEKEENKEYLPMQGLDSFRKATVDLLLGQNHPATAEARPRRCARPLLCARAMTARACCSRERCLGCVLPWLHGCRHDCNLVVDALVRMHDDADLASWLRSVHCAPRLATPESASLRR
jgi:hypothetical protein